MHTIKYFQDALSPGEYALDTSLVDFYIDHNTDSRLDLPF